MKVSNVDKDMVEQSTTVPNSQSITYLNHTLGLTLSTPGLVENLEIGEISLSFDHKIIILVTTCGHQDYVVM